MASRFLLARARLRLARSARRFARAEQGATAVEFALVAIPFLMLIFAIIELGLVFLVSITLESAVIDAGRTIRTGEVQTAGSDAAAFKTAVCNRMDWLGSRCTTALRLDVRTFADYSTGTTSATNGTVPTTMSWNPGTSGSIVLVRAYYTWPLITPLLNTGLQTSNGQRIIYAATSFTNEPYDQ
ncbi:MULTISPECIES: TadE/TadG family type IV pilus assembly protein [unclassified Caulobacter]|jgi:Flp pilus assembly protein TadG|uniref:TadE/TadG family type IV pilus assembly protein n=1 Tax=unclassified Caulobacter TaxID=2648921 RepID=UPI0007821F9E|nr:MULTISPECIES: TadE/TadG family type IV pilus assembly protein [unclassified Caulobacter]AZS20361.1 pilus assembly protein [Caulobacter sp. FWC26]